MSTTRDLPADAPVGDHVCTLLPDGREECLACGKEWPCEDATRTYVAPLAPQEPRPNDVLMAAAAARIPWPIVADQYGVDRAAVQEYLDANAG